MNTPFRFALLIVLVAAFGCGQKSDNPPARCDNAICTVDEGDDTLRTVVDASHDDEWVYFDFESAGQVSIDDPMTSTAWDLGFRRMVVKTNGGVNGNGQVEVVLVEDEDFDTYSVAPSTGWQSDVAGNDEDRDPGGTVFNEDPWYDYDLFSHSLQPNPSRFYLIRTVESGTFKLRFDGYYSVDDEAAWPSFTWATVAPF